MNTKRITRATGALRGRVEISGDKSVSIRRALLSLTTADDVDIENYGSGEDCLTALVCLERLGKTVHREGRTVRITGSSRPRSADLDCANSGTCARLLMGLLAGSAGEWRLRGDASLSRRPMERVVEPLRGMGAEIRLTSGCLPARVRGVQLSGIDYESRVASAQVKSACLLAGLQAKGVTRYREPYPSRDHTERLLHVSADADGWLTMDPNQVEIAAASLCGPVPSDVSSAAFWGVAGTIVPDSRIVLPEILDNPLRKGWIDVLRGAGSEIYVSERMRRGVEYACTITVHSSTLRPFEIGAGQTPVVIDELPILAVAATQSPGTSRFTSVGELRHKESDRLVLIRDNLRAMGAEVDIRGDNLIVQGPCALRGAAVTTAGDHRIAMAFAIAGLVAEGTTEIDDPRCVTVSYPEFWAHLDRLSDAEATP